MRALRLCPAIREKKRRLPGRRKKNRQRAAAACVRALAAFAVVNAILASSTKIQAMWHVSCLLQSWSHFEPAGEIDLSRSLPCVAHAGNASLFWTSLITLISRLSMIRQG